MRKIFAALLILICICVSNSAWSKAPPPPPPPRISPTSPLHPLNPMNRTSVAARANPTGCSELSNQTLGICPGWVPDDYGDARFCAEKIYLIKIKSQPCILLQEAEEKFRARQQDEKEAVHAWEKKIVKWMLTVFLIGVLLTALRSYFWMQRS